MKTTEASIQATLKHALETLGYTVLEVANGRSRKVGSAWTGTTPGTPDLFISHPDWPQGEWLGMELKTPTGKLRPEQKRLNEAGRTVVVRSVAEGLETVGWAESGLCLGGQVRAGVRREKVFAMAEQFKEVGK